MKVTDPSGEFVFSLIAIAIIAGKKIAGAWLIGLIVGIAGTLDVLIAVLT